MLWLDFGTIRGCRTQPAQIYTSGPNIVGYEWDSDLDNGFRPAGLIDLSSSTVFVPEMILDAFGISFGEGTPQLDTLPILHGTLVFGAGTVQWSWGLDSNHDGNSTSVDPAIQQATVNLLADMGVQPGSLQPGLTASSPSTDRTAPASTITSVGNGLNIRTGYPVTVTGTAVDYRRRNSSQN